MTELSKLGIITENCFFASFISSYLCGRKKYVPIFSLPRMNRPDWKIEIGKRVNAIRKSRIESLFCQGEDYGLLAPLRDKIKPKNPK